MSTFSLKQYVLCPNCNQRFGVWTNYEMIIPAEVALGLPPMRPMLFDYGCPHCTCLTDAPKYYWNLLGAKLQDFITYGV